MELGFIFSFGFRPLWPQLNGEANETVRLNNTEIETNVTENRKSTDTTVNELVQDQCKKNIF